MACKINEYISKLEKSLPDIHDRLDEKYMPEFNKLPKYKEGQRNLTVATVGSRETPPDILEKMTSIGKYLSNKGYVLQSGGAIGADMAFEGKSYPKTLTAKNEVKNKKGKVVLNAGEIVKIGTKRFTDAYYVFNSKDNKGQIQASEWVKNTPTKNVTSFSSFDITQNKFGNADKAKTIANELHPSEKQLSTWPEALMARNTYQVFGKNLDKPVDFVLFYAEETDNPLRPKGGTGQAIEMARRKGIPTINMADKDWKKQLDDNVNKKTTEYKHSQQSNTTVTAYHGTDQEFSNFDIRKAGGARDAKLGHYFTSSLRNAVYYAVLKKYPKLADNFEAQDEMINNIMKDPFNPKHGIYIVTADIELKNAGEMDNQGKSKSFTQKEADDKSTAMQEYDTVINRNVKDGVEVSDIYLVKDAKNIHIQTKPTELKWLTGRNIIVDSKGRPKVQVDTLEDLISLADEFHKMMVDKHAPGSKNYTKHVEWFKEIFNDLDKKGINFQPVEIEFTDKVPKDSLGWQEYSSGKQKIKLNTNKLTPAYPLKVVLHEYAHAITLSKLNQYPVLKKKTRALMDRAKKELKGIDTNPNTEYVFTNEEEFLAEVISNPQLQTELNKLDSTDTGYVAQVKKIFKELLARITKKDATALTDALNIVVELNNQTESNTVESPTIEAYYKDETATMTLRERKQYEEKMANKAVKEGC